MSTTTTKATFTKLRDGAWGLRVVGTATKGDRVTVTKKSGKASTETVKAVLWSGPDRSTGQTITLCSSEPTARPASRRRRSGGGGCHTDGNCSWYCAPNQCPCGDGHWFRCC